MPAPSVPAEPGPDTELSTSQAARLARVDRSTLARYADQGIVACRRLPSGHRRFRHADIVALVATGTSS